MPQTPELFTAKGTPNVDQEGRWIERAGIEVYHWFCQSRQHLLTDFDVAKACCSKRDQRVIDERGIEISLFDDAC